MSEQITPQIFEHLVQLAALELSRTEAEYLRQELNKQLKAIHELEAIPLTKDTPITLHGVPYTPEITPPIREDQLDAEMDDESAEKPCAEAILAQAPEVEDRYIVVPDIPHTEL